MSQLQNFNHYMFGDLPVVVVDGIEWFGATEAAKALSFADPHKAINNHVEEDDSTVRPVTDNLGRIQQKKFINEAGLYSLIIGAAKQGNNPEIKEKAKSFKRWIVGEVLPSIRKTGSYGENKVVALSERQALIQSLKLTAELAEEMEEVKSLTQTHSQKLIEIEQKVDEQITLDHGEQRVLQKAVAKRVYEVESDPKLRRELFRQLHREIKDRWAVASYRDVRRHELQQVLRYIDAWMPRKVS